MTSSIAQETNSLMSFDCKELNYPIADIQEQLLPTTEDIDFFQEHGWFITKKVIPETVIDRIFAASNEFYQGVKDSELPYDGCSNWQPGDRVSVRNNEYISFQKKAFRELSLMPIIGAIAGKLMNTNIVRYFQDQLVTKEIASDRDQKPSTIGWHTDGSYHSNCTSLKLLTAWIPLHDVREEHGPLVVLDRSHKWSNTEHMRGFNHANHQEIERQFIQQNQKINKIPIQLKKGQISFHHSSLVHCSYENRSNIQRRVVALNLQDGENRYQLFWNNGKQIHHYVDSLCRKQANGLPDYTDPRVFPVVWQQ